MNILTKITSEEYDNHQTVLVIVAVERRLSDDKILSFTVVEEDEYDDWLNGDFSDDIRIKAELNKIILK